MKHTSSAPFRGHTSNVYAIAEIKADGAIVSTSSDGTVKVWETSQGKCRNTILSLGTDQYPSDITVLDDETVLIACSDREAKVMRVKDGHILASRVFPYELTACAKITPTIALLCDSKGNLTKVEWVGKKLNILNHVEEEQNGGWKSSIHVHGNKFSTTDSKDDNTAKLWDLETFSLLHAFEGPNGSVDAATFDDNYFVCSASDNTIRVFDVHTYELVTIIHHKSYSIGCVCIVEGTNLIVSGGIDRTLLIHELLTGDCIGTIEVGMWICCIAVLSSGKVAVGGDSPFDIKLFEIDELMKRRSDYSTTQDSDASTNDSPKDEIEGDFEKKNVKSLAKNQFANFTKRREKNVLTLDDATDAMNDVLSGTEEHKRISADEFEEIFMALSDDIQVTEATFLKVLDKLVGRTANFEEEYRMNFQKYINKRNTVSVPFAARVLRESFKNMKNQNLLEDEELPEETQLEELVTKFDIDGDGKVNCEDFVAAALSIVHGIEKNGVL